jgi:hypothetical protein
MPERGAAPPAGLPAARPAAARLLAARALLLAGVASLLASGIAGGLWRAGVALPLPDLSAWPGQAVAGHAFLMIGAFMGTVIGIERAVALKGRPAFAPPALAALSGGLMLAGAAQAAAWLSLAASVGFVAVNAAVVARQRAAHTVLLLVGACAWAVGNALLALGGPAGAPVPWWLAFLVLTIAAERLELTRLMRRRRGAAPALQAILALLLAGAALFVVRPAAGSLVFGAGLALLSAWLVAFDIARRTITARGLSRYMAVCLLAGHAWLGVSGLAWMALPWLPAARDTALHALGLGFVFSMVMGHAPVILPALARIKVQYSGVFYAPLLLLHASLALRLAGGLAAGLAGAPGGAGLVRLGAAGNAAAIALFAATMAGAALAWRRAHRAGPGAAPDARHRRRPPAD